jgi:N-sulfoglucosamine sulfohydrolase
VDRLVSFVDFAPTLLSLAGVPIPKHFQGSAFLGDAAKPAAQAMCLVRATAWTRRSTPRAPYATRAGSTSATSARIFRGARLSPIPTRVRFVSNSSPTQPRVRLGKGAHGMARCRRDRWRSSTTRRPIPIQLKNLAADPCPDRAELKRLRATLHGWLIEIRDATFVTEEEVMQHTGGGSPYSRGCASGDDYPLERILRVAAMVGDPGGGRGPA